MMQRSTLWLCAMTVLLLSSRSFAEDYRPPKAVKVLPLFFVPKGESSPSVRQVADLQRHLTWAQARYKQMLKWRDTFALAKDKPQVYHAEHDAAYYRRQDQGAAPQIVDELLRHYKYNRYNCPWIFVAIVIESARRLSCRRRPPVQRRRQYRRRHRRNVVLRTGSSPELPVHAAARVGPCFRAAPRRRLRLRHDGEPVDHVVQPEAPHARLQAIRDAGRPDRRGYPRPGLQPPCVSPPPFRPEDGRAARIQDAENRHPRADEHPGPSYHSQRISPVLASTTAPARCMIEYGRHQRPNGWLTA